MYIMFCVVIVIFMLGLLLNHNSMVFLFFNTNAWWISSEGFLVIIFFFLQSVVHWFWYLYWRVECLDKILPCGISMNSQNIMSFISRSIQFVMGRIYFSAVFNFKFSFIKCEFGKRTKHCLVRLKFAPKIKDVPIIYFGCFKCGVLNCDS